MIAEPSSSVYPHAFSLLQRLRKILIGPSLSKYLIDRRHGKAGDSEDEIKLMGDLVEQYSDFKDVDRAVESKGVDDDLRNGHVVVSALYQFLQLKQQGS